MPFQNSAPLEGGVSDSGNDTGSIDTNAPDLSREPSDGASRMPLKMVADFIPYFDGKPGSKFKLEGESAKRRVADQTPHCTRRVYRVCHRFDIVDAARPPVVPLESDCFSQGSAEFLVDTGSQLNGYWCRDDQNAGRGCCFNP